MLQNSFAIGDGENLVTINIDPNQRYTSVEAGNCPRFETVTEISMPTELLRRLSIRKRDYKGFTTLHWNQADVGLHFLWRRKGEFELASHSLLNFYGTYSGAFIAKWKEKCHDFHERLHKPNGKPRQLHLSIKFKRLSEPTSKLQNSQSAIP